eukprot:6031998-Prymnesium_polylepis.1
MGGRVGSAEVRVRVRVRVRSGGGGGGEATRGRAGGRGGGCTLFAARARARTHRPCKSLRPTAAAARTYDSSTFWKGKAYGCTAWWTAAATASTPSARPACSHTMSTPSASRSCKRANGGVGLWSVQRGRRSLERAAGASVFGACSGVSVFGCRSLGVGHCGLRGNGSKTAAAPQPRGGAIERWCAREAVRSTGDAIDSRTCRALERRCD